jgi:hypothetical protein
MGVELEGNWHLGDRADESVRFIAFLRDAYGEGLPVRWVGCVDAEIAGLISHLPPPQRSCAEASVAAWREAHVFGLAYWRQGPSFIMVKDTRPARAAARFLIYDEITRDAFLFARQPRVLVGVAPDVEQAIDSLVQEGLVLRIGTWVTVLPYRMRRWPIPAFAV